MYLFSKKVICSELVHPHESVAQGLFQLVGKCLIIWMFRDGLQTFPETTKNKGEVKREA